MDKLKKLFQKTLPEYYVSQEYQDLYNDEIMDCEKPHVELKNR